MYTYLCIHIFIRSGDDARKGVIVIGTSRPEVVDMSEWRTRMRAPTQTVLCVCVCVYINTYVCVCARARMCG